MIRPASVQNVLQRALWERLGLGLALLGDVASLRGRAVGGDFMSLVGVSEVACGTLISPTFVPQVWDEWFCSPVQLGLYTPPNSASQSLTET